MTLESATQQWIEEHRHVMESRTTVTIPVVVHIVWRLPNQQISEAQILSQIDVINEDFRALNDDLSTVPANFQDDIADLEIEFCLAKQTPEGDPTNGITYTQTSVENAGTAQSGGQRVIFHSNLGGKDAWDTESYLNIWVAERGFACGESSFPDEAGSAEDGIIIRFDCFGTNGTADAPYNLGRTTTHEIGHYFNLLHLWGSGENDFACQEDDMVDDTPPQAFSYLEQCPVPPQMSCGDLDMFMNFMNFSDDACLNMFSNGQKERVWAALNMYRSSLLDSEGCQMPTMSTSELSYLKNEIQLLSQPAQSSIELGLTDPSLLPLEIRLFQVNGTPIWQDKWHNSNKYSLNCEQFPSGIYIIAVTSHSQIWIQKVIIVE